MARAESPGAKIFLAQHCNTCHSIQGSGGTLAPDLSHEGSRQTKDWILAQLDDPRSPKPGSNMPSFKQLPEADKQALAHYLANLKRGYAMRYKSQFVSREYFLAALALFFLQVLFGILSSVKYVWDRDPLLNLLPFNVTRSIHINLLVFWLLLALMGATYYMVSDEIKTEI